MDITRGKITCAKKVVVYGPEGIGKSTFASRFPDPVFIDTEGSTKDMDVSRLPRPTSWNMLMEEIQYVKEKNLSICKTLVIDTTDWAEQLCVEHICAIHHKSGIEDFGYGNGYVYTKEEFGRFLNRLEDVVETGINVVLTAHAQIRKFEQPDELGSYDRWELKLGKKTSSQTSPLVKEWADMLLFCNYKTYSVAVDDKGKKHKAQGGKRVMYTSHHPCWDAKNRYGLPEECEFSYSVIADIIEQQPGVEKKTESRVKEEIHPEESFMDIPKTADEKQDFNTGQKIPEAEETKPAPEPPKEPEPDMSQTETFRLPDYIPKALQDLMTQHGVLDYEVKAAVAAKGYFPEDMPIEDYPDGFIKGVLIGAWGQVYEWIEKNRASLPF